jgi:hypothetical protein
MTGRAAADALRCRSDAQWLRQRRGMSGRGLRLHEQLEFSARHRNPSIKRGYSAYRSPSRTRLHDRRSAAPLSPPPARRAGTLTDTNGHRKTATARSVPRFDRVTFSGRGNNVTEPLRSFAAVAACPRRAVAGTGRMAIPPLRKSSSSCFYALFEGITRFRSVPSSALGTAEIGRFDHAMRALSKAPLARARPSARNNRSDEICQVLAQRDHRSAT